MSKKLLKIISICAFVVMLPVVILGVAMAVSTNKGVTLTVFDGGDNTEAEGWKSEISISVNNVKQDSNKITVKKGTYVTLSWEGSGYEFNGWFKGNESEIQGTATAEAVDTTYKFKLNNNTVLTGVKSFLSLKIGDNSIKYNPDTKKFEEYSPSYDNHDNYNFVGFKYNNNIYYKTEDNDYCVQENNSKLSDVIAAEGKSLTVTEVWKAVDGYCSALNITIDTVVYVDSAAYSVYVGTDETKTEIDDMMKYLIFDDTISAGNAVFANLNDNIINFLFGENAEYYINKGGKASQVVLKDTCKINVNGETINLDHENVKFKDLMDSIKGETTLNNDDNIKLTFEFEVKTETQA